MNYSVALLNLSLVAQDAPMTPKDSFAGALAKNAVAVLVWLALSAMNSAMVATFLQHSTFYEDPRYIMFISMVINDAVQLSLVTALYVVSYVFFRIPAPACCLLVVPAVLTTRCTPFILAGMAVERYTAICFPLHYRQACTLARTHLLIGAIVLLSGSMPLTDLLLTLATRPLDLLRPDIFCDHALLFSDRAVYLKNLAFDAIFLSAVFLVLFYTYLKIVLAARAASADVRSAQKARNTVLLHGLQLALCQLALVVPSVQTPLLQLFPRYSLEIRYVNFLLVYIIPRFLSPVIYGFRDAKFRRHWVRYMMRVSSKVYPSAKVPH